MTQRPAPLPLLVTVAGVILLLGLAGWQMQRRAWKHELLATLHERLTAAPIPLPDHIDNPEDWRYRRVVLRGRFLDGRDMLVSGQQRQGSMGYDMLSLLQPDHGGPAVLVNRGFVPLDWRDPAVRLLPAAAAAPQEITGIARPPAPQLFMQPDNDPAAMGAWVWIDLPAMAAAAGLPQLAPVIVDLVPDGPAPPGGFPRPHAPRVDLPDHHLLYALTWTAMAGALATVYILWRRLRRRFRFDAEWDE